MFNHLSRKLLFLGRIVRMESSKYLPQMLTAITPGKRCRGRPFRNIRDAFVDGLRLVISEISDR